MKLTILLLLASLTLGSSAPSLGSYLKDKAFGAASAVVDVAINNPISRGLMNVTAPAARAIGNEVGIILNPIKRGVIHILDGSCGMVKRIEGVAYDQYNGEQETELNKLILEYRETGLRVTYNILTAADQLPQDRRFNTTQHLYIFVHGFTQVPGVFDSISQALMRRNSLVLALDCSSLTRGLYFRSTTYVRFIGERLGQFLAALVRNGLNPNAIHMIGHSLGAHISGFTGKRFTFLTQMKMGRISGLDPSNVCFGHVDPELRLHRDDADFIDVVHTDAGVFGLRDPLGHVEFYPNGGEQQPDCVSLTCSHNRALDYFAEALERPLSFPALKCEDWNAFKNGQCSEEKQLSYMGLLCQPGVTGRFFLQTDGAPLFGLGEVGLRWRNNDGIIKNTYNRIIG